MDAMMVQLQTALAMGEDIVDRNPTACLTPYMVRMEKDFGGSRASWFLGLFSCVTFLLYLIGGLALITNLVGFLYPAFASFKAIDSPDALASQQWLSYWAVFGAFFTSETAFPFVVNLVPYYNVWKMLVFVYCFHPYTKGATKLYDGVLRPLIIQHVLPGTGAAKRRAAASPSPAGAAAAAVSAPPGFSTSQAGLTRGVPAVTVPAVADLITPELSELRVVVISASDVVPTEAPGQGVDCDPYCVLEVLPVGFRQKQGAAEKTKYKTACKTGTANPVWNERVTIPQVEHLDAKLVVTVCNKRAMGRDQCLGKIEVPLLEAKVKGAVEPADMVLALTQTEDSTTPPCGDLRVTVQLK